MVGAPILQYINDDSLLTNGYQASVKTMSNLVSRNRFLDRLAWEIIDVTGPIVLEAARGVRTYKMS